jgi:tetratricopeptide (TPR) repeat protein
MNKNTIEYLAYLLDKAHKEEGREKSIVFLGAGASVSAGIPLTSTIVRHIKIKFCNNPIIKECIKTMNDDYYSLMGALTADERRDLFHFYVTREKVKLNIANIYLAQLLKLGYIDYIVTVNFDDLILKACTLYNFLPPVYDISNIKTITTTDIRKNSVIYLHGQYFGQWLLNNPDELQKVEDEVLRLFNAIKTRRTWIIVGYSGNDGIFDKIKSLGSFSNELFWIKKRLDDRNDINIINFLQTTNLNVNKIEGYYADSFFLKLHAELSKLDRNLNAPEIISKPFTFVKSVLQTINEVNEDNELNNNVKQMLTLCNERIDKAINEYEEEGTVDNLKQRIVDAILKDNFSDELALSFEDEIKIKNYEEALEQLSWYYNEWGAELLLSAKDDDSVSINESVEKLRKACQLNPNDAKNLFNLGNGLLKLGRIERKKEIFEECFKVFEKASLLEPNDYAIYNNWGNSLSQLGKLENQEDVFKNAIEKYETAFKLNNNNSNVLFNWASALLSLGMLTNIKGFFEQSIEKYNSATILSPNDGNIFYSLGVALSRMANNEQSESIYNESIEKFKKAMELKPNDYKVLYAFGNTLTELGILKNDIKIFNESISKYEEALILEPEGIEILNNLGTALIHLSYLDDKKRDFLLKQAKEISKKKYSLDDDPYNLSCSYALLGEKENALKYLKETLNKKSVELSHIEADKDWNRYKADNDFINLLNEYRKS